MYYYASKCHDVLNKKPFTPETVIGKGGLMVNPKYPKITIGSDCPYIIDSGAFQDVKSEHRLSFEDALERQLALEKIIGRPCEAIVSYDRLVDEQCEDGKQFKSRVDEDTGREYVEETVAAAEYLCSRRKDLEGRKLILSCQGATVSQYIECAERIMEISQPGDILGIGGFCILSRSKQYRQDYFEIINAIVPRLHAHGIERIHIFGMSVFEVLCRTDMICRQYGISVSYDTSSAEINSVFGRIWSPEDAQMHGTFEKSEKYTEYHPCDLALFNIKNIVIFWENWNNLQENR